MSIQDVAALAEVSTATVSRVLNNPGLVSSATAARVHRAVEVLGYRPNAMAKALMTRRTHVLGLAIPEMHGEFYTEVLRGADAEARARGYHLLVSSEAGGARGAEWPFAHVAGLLDGLAIMLTEPDASLADQARSSAVPVVVLDSQIDLNGFDSVRIDNRVGTREAVEHLLQSTPPERCFFVGGPPGNFDTQERAGEFRRVLRRAGGPLTREQIVYGAYDADTGRRWVAETLRSGSLRGAAALAANDEIALGILQAAHAAGLLVPRDLAIVGFDDTRLASVLSPKLSSVRVPRADFGRAAMESLIRRIEEPEASVRETRLPTALVVRESSLRPEVTKPA